MEMERPLSRELNQKPESKQPFPFETIDGCSKVSKKNSKCSIYISNFYVEQNNEHSKHSVSKLAKNLQISKNSQ